jgi:hypothetical protein
LNFHLALGKWVNEILGGLAGCPSALRVGLIKGTLHILRNGP